MRNTATCKARLFIKVWYILAVRSTFIVSAIYLSSLHGQAADEYERFFSFIGSVLGPSVICHEFDSAEKRIGAGPQSMVVLARPRMPAFFCAGYYFARSLYYRRSTGFFFAGFFQSPTHFSCK